MTRMLKKRYKGKTILPHHMSYNEFLAQATDDEKTYFKFAVIRNPMDTEVSKYIKKKNDHNGIFSKGVMPGGRKVTEKDKIEFAFIKDNNASFARYFQEFAKGEYVFKKQELTLSNMDRVLRYENLENELKSMLAELDLPYYPLPTVNKTAHKDSDFQSSYTPEIVPQAVFFFGRFMKDWGYEFPPGWEEEK